MRWYRHVLRRDNGHVLRKVLEFEVKGKGKQGQPKKTWKTQVEKKSTSVGLENGGGHESSEMERLLLEWGKSGHPCLRG